VSEQSNPEQSVTLTRTEVGMVEDGLMAAHEFIQSVTEWTGHEDDLAEVNGAIEDALAKLGLRS
jgi:hypothetical protein